MLLAAGKLIGAGLATIGAAGAGVGIGIIFGCFLNAYSRNPGLKSEMLFILYGTINFIILLSFLLLSLNLEFIAFFVLIIYLGGVLTFIILFNNFKVNLLYILFDAFLNYLINLVLFFVALIFVLLLFNYFIEQNVYHLLFNYSHSIQLSGVRIEPFIKLSDYTLLEPNWEYKYKLLITPMRAYLFKEFPDFFICGQMGINYCYQLGCYAGPDLERGILLFYDFTTGGYFLQT